MKIISNFKDYYDGLQDPEDRLIYLRLSKELPAPSNLFGFKKLPRPPPAYYKQKHYIDCACSLVGFCGKAYPFWHWKARNRLECPANGVYTSPLKLEQAVRTLPKRTNNLEYDKDISFAKRATVFLDTPWRSWRNPLKWNLEGWERWQNLYNKPIPTELFREIDTPIFMLRRKELYDEHSPIVLITNPCLKDLGFPKLVPTWEAYQELDMYLGNQLAKQVELGNTGDDKVIRDARGFDDNSFKSMAPGEKKARRKKNKRRKRNASS